MGPVPSTGGTAAKTEPEAVLAEVNRLSALASLGIMDTEPEQVFEDAVHLASAICGTPISLVSLVDGQRQWFKAKVGFERSETPRDEAFCAHAINQPDLFIVSDARVDNRFVDNPLVTGITHIRFYAGMPLRNPDGYALGTLCVMDSVPRQLTPEQKLALSLLAQQVANQLQLRAQVRHLSDTLVERTRFQKKICDSNALFQAFMDNSPVTAYLKDAYGRMVYYNRLFEERFHIAGDEWIGKNDAEIWPPNVAASLRKDDLAVLHNGNVVVTEDSSPGPSGTALHWRTYKFPFVDASGDRYVASVSLDTSLEKEADLALKKSHEELHKANQRLRELSVTDALTGLYNRRGFNDRIHQEVASATRHGFDFSILLADVDNFKSLNDTFGHDEGDEVLRSLAALLRKGARASDIVCRYGGEEFAILLPNTDQEAAVRVGDRIRASIETACWKCRQVTVSAGVGTRAPDCTEVSALLRRADLALYEAKALGKNRVVPYRSELEQNSPPMAKAIVAAG